MNNLKKGDRVITKSGVHAKVMEVNEKDEKEDKKLTMTGKKKEPVEINPNIKMEKKKQKNW